jgi:hypothetical protein
LSIIIGDSHQVVIALASLNHCTSQYRASRISIIKRRFPAEQTQQERPGDKPASDRE